MALQDLFAARSRHEILACAIEMTKDKIETVDNELEDITHLLRSIGSSYPWPSA